MIISWNSQTCFGNKIKVTCDCGASNFFTPCIHMKWFGSRHLNSKNPKEWTISCLEIFKEKNTNFKIIYGKNEECLICLEKIHYNKQNTIICSGCNNGCVGINITFTIL